MDQTVPLICGAVYERTDPRSGLPERITVLATKRQVGGELVGLARSFEAGYELEFTEGSEDMIGWKMVAKPMELDAPISAGDIVEHQNVSLKKQLSAAKARVEELERAERRNSLTDDRLVDLVEKGTKWGQIGKPFNMGWPEVKKRFESLAAAGELDGASPAAKRAARILRAGKGSEDSDQAAAK